ncbi:MAG: hypothetical protein HOP13_06600 [Alphaproteobacteria bacterium]|nr:hypothetical protein [Alphaproteobacteria bacterium]
MFIDASLTLIVALVIGFAISGIMSNLFQLMLNGASLLHFPVTSDWRRLAVVGIMLLAGPHILVRAADRSLRGGDWPFTYTASCFGLGLVWSGVLGYAALAAFVL